MDSLTPIPSRASARAASRMTALRTSVLIAGALAFLAPSLRAGTYTVTTASDAALRAAIVSANTDSAAAIINFNIAGGGTITLSSMLPLLTNPNGITIDGANGGQGTITIDGGSTSASTGDRIFFVGISSDTANANLPATPSTTFSISNLTLAHGNARGGKGGGGGRNAGGGGAGLGGAIFVNAGTLSLANVSFVGNIAVGGAGGTAGGSSTPHGGGGGMGGNGGAAGTGGGGGFGIGADGGAAAASHAAGFTGAFFNGTFGGASGGTGGISSNPGGAGGANGGGGGGGPWVGSIPGGGGGGVGGVDASAGSTGGFGGGGGGGNSQPPGFGGGNAASSGTARNGGGGAAMGGAAFVRSGAGLSVSSGVSYSGSSVTGGAGASSGSGLAPDVFLDGISAIGRITMASGADLNANTTLGLGINGATTAGTSYSQLSVTGSVSLGDATLVLNGSYQLATGESVVLVDNDGTDAINGTFSGLPEGSIVTFNGISLILSYVGGTGNDVTLSRPSGAELSSLVLSTGTLNPAFSATGTSYTATVAASVTSITVTPTVLQGGATVRVNGTLVTSGTASGSIALNVGANTITVVGTASNGTTTKTYQISVTRSAPVNNPPVASADTLTRANNTKVAKVLKSALIANDTDPDGDTLSITAVSNPQPSGATVVIAGNFVVFTAPTTTAGNGSFDYTLSDGSGGHTVTGSVTVSEISATTPVGAPNAIRILPSGLDFVVTFIGVPGNPYRIQYTTDLNPPYTWSEFSPQATYTAPDTGVFEHTDVNPAETSRLYRAIANA